MANQQTTEFAVLEASPPGIAARQLVGAKIVKTSGVFDWVDPSDTDTLQICRVPVDSNLLSLKLGYEDFGTTLTVQIGFYKVGDPGGVIDINAIGVDLAFGTATTGMVEQRYLTQNIDTVGEFMWELANLADRPSYEEMDIVLTVTAETSAVTKAIAWIIEYTL